MKLRRYALRPVSEAILRLLPSLSRLLTVADQKSYDRSENVWIWLKLPKHGLWSAQLLDEERLSEYLPLTSKWYWPSVLDITGSDRPPYSGTFQLLLFPYELLLELREKYGAWEKTCIRADVTYCIVKADTQFVKGKFILIFQFHKHWNRVWQLNAYSYYT